MNKYEKYLQFFSENGIELNNSQLDDLRYISSGVVNEDFAEFKDFVQTWKYTNQSHNKQKFFFNGIPDDEYEDLKKIFQILKTETNYSKYKKAFDDLCKFCRIRSDGTIITKYKLSKGNKPNQNSILVEYSINTKKIQLPKDVNLYHISDKENIKALIPAFRGKSQKGYLYDTPRVYFSIMKNMPKFLADFKPSDKTYRYICLDKSIKEVYVDPLANGITQGALYVVTNKPIPVAEVSTLNKAVEKSTRKISAVEDIKESGRFDDYPDCIDDDYAHLDMITNEEVIVKPSNVVHEMSDEQINMMYTLENEITQEVNSSCKNVFENRQALCKRAATVDGQFDQNEYNVCLKRLGTHAPTFDELYDEDGKCYIDLSLSQMAYVYGIGLDFEAAVARDLNKHSQKFYYYTDKEDPGICVKFRSKKISESLLMEGTTGSNGNSSVNSSNANAQINNNQQQNVANSTSSNNNQTGLTPGATNPDGSLKPTDDSKPVGKDANLDKQIANNNQANNNSNNSSSTNTTTSPASANTTNSQTINSVGGNTNNSTTPTTNTSANTNTSSTTTSSGTTSSSSSTNTNVADNKSDTNSAINQGSNTSSVSASADEKADEEEGKEQEELDKKLAAQRGDKSGDNSSDNTNNHEKSGEDTNS